MKKLILWQGIITTVMLAVFFGVYLSTGDYLSAAFAALAATFVVVSATTFVATPKTAFGAALSAAFAAAFAAVPADASMVVSAATLAVTLAGTLAVTLAATLVILGKSGTVGVSTMRTVLLYGAQLIVTAVPILVVIL
jgi:hypothetical protein